MCVDNFLDWINAHMTEMVSLVPDFKDFIILRVVSGSVPRNSIELNFLFLIR